LTDRNTFRAELRQWTLPITEPGILHPVLDYFPLPYIPMVHPNAASPPTSHQITHHRWRSGGFKVWTLKLQYIYISISNYFIIQYFDW